MITERKFYVSSILWGFPVTLVGGIVAAVLLLRGYKPKRFGWCWCFEVEGNFGLNLGLVFLCCKGASDGLKAHEFGHAIQNAYFGPFHLFITISSGIRFWWRELLTKIGVTNLPPYDSVWFESQATEWGVKYYVKIMTEMEGEGS